MRPFIRNAVFFLGWLLSPLTFWNDAFVNIPLSFIFANILAKVINTDFLQLVLISYWVTNALGLFLIYVAGKDALKSKAGVAKAIIILIFTSFTYSIIIIGLGKLGILKPI